MGGHKKANCWKPPPCKKVAPIALFILLKTMDFANLMYAPDLRN